MEIKCYYATITSAWKFFRRWMEAPAIDWDKVVTEANAEAHEDPFAVKLYAVMVGELEQARAGTAGRR